MAKKPATREFRFSIEAYSPDTMPMARLAAYVAELATVLGETSSVHLVRVESGSTTVVHAIDREALPKVRARAEAVRRGEGPAEAQAAYRRVNQLLREDNARAVLREWRRGPKVLEFPGTTAVEETFPTVSQLGSISGVLVRVGGRRDQVPILLESEGREIVGCHASRAVAKELARRLFEPVRLVGQGYWLRNEDGEWSLSHFRVDSFESLEDSTLSAALTELRAVAGEWSGTFEELLTFRQGPGNGRD
jgi:hypothetical protein